MSYYYTQIAKLNVPKKCPALLTRIKNNIAMAVTLINCNIQPKKRQQLINAIIADMQVAHDKKLLSEDNRGYIVYNDTMYNPTTGVFVLSVKACSPDRDHYMNEQMVLFTKPVKTLTNEEIYNKNPEPVNVIPKEPYRQRDYYAGPETNKLTICRFHKAVDYISETNTLRADGTYSYNVHKIKRKLGDDIMDVIRNTPMIVYVIMAMMMKIKTSSIVKELFYKEQDYIDTLKMAMVQEESHFPIAPTDEEGYTTWNITQRLTNLMGGYKSVVQMFDTSMAHYIDISRCARYWYKDEISEDTIKSNKRSGYLTIEDERFNFSNRNRSTFETLHSIKVPTNDSLLRLKTIIDETNLKGDADWAYRGDAAIAILETIRDAALEYEDITFDDINIRSEYPSFEKYSEENERYWQHISMCPVMLGVGFKKDLETIYGLFTKLAERNNYFREFLCGSNCIQKGFTPSFKLDNEIYKDTYADMLTDDEIEAAMSFVETTTDKYYGISRNRYYATEEEMAQYPEFYGTQEPCLAAFTNRFPGNNDYHISRITFDRTMTDRLSEFYEVVKMRALSRFYHYQNNNTTIGYVSSRDAVAVSAVTETIFAHRKFHDAANISCVSDDFITIKHFNTDDIIDSGFVEIN